MRDRVQTTAQKHQSTTNNEPVSHSINYFLVSSFKIELSICVLYSGGEYVIQSSRIIKVACAKFTAHFRYCSVPEKGEVYKKIANLNCICHHSLYMFCAFSLRTKMETINWPNMQTNKQTKKDCLEYTGFAVTLSCIEYNFACQHQPNNTRGTSTPKLVGTSKYSISMNTHLGR